MLYFHSLQACKNQGLTGLAADSRRYGKDNKDIRRISLLPAKARVFETFHT